MADQFVAEIEARLSTDKLENQLSNLKPSTKLKIDIDGNYIKTQIESALSGISSKSSKIDLNNLVDTGNVQRKVQNVSKQIDTALNSININSTKKAIDDMQQVLKSFNFDDSSINLITQDLEKMSVSIRNISTQLDGDNLQIRISGTDEIGRVITVLKQFNSESEEITTVSTQIKQSIEDIGTATNNIVKSFNNGDISNQISKVEESFRKINNQSIETQTSMVNLRTAFNDLNNAIQSGNMIEIKNSYDNYINALKQARNQIDKNTRSEKEFQNAVKEADKNQQNLAKASTLSNNIQSWMNSNTEAAQKYSAELTDLQNKLQSMIASGNVSGLSNISAEFQKIKSEANATGLSISSFTSSLGSTVKQLLGLTSTVAVIGKVTSEIKQGVQTVIELDDALIDLKKTTTMSSSELTSFYKEANSIAKEYGSTTQEIIQSAADWSRLGYSDYDSATTMAKLSSQFATISPGMTIDTATKGLVSTMKAYGIEADNVLDGIMSKINEVGNTAATSNEEIVIGLEQSAAAMAAMGGTLEENIAIFTAAQEITQDASKVGNAIRSITMRIRGRLQTSLHIGKLICIVPYYKTMMITV